MRARRSLIRSALFGAVAAGVPLFVVLYWLSFEQGFWWRVLIAQLIYVGFFAIVALRHRAIFLEVTPTKITKQGLFARGAFDSGDVASLYLADVQHASAHDPVSQLVALGADGRRLFRMRGTFWDREAMVTVASVIGAPLTIESRHLTMKEFYAARPGVAYWYEGKPWIAAAGIVVAFGLAYLVLSWLLFAIGVPSVLTLPF
ncbi:MAG: hypothetical protein Q8M65_01915 [Rhodoglobus sp.]|nr:hypothetical protein [Rhodoglobus sp.]